MLHKFWCGLRGHDFVMEHNNHDRQWLRCVSCWHRTPGWDRTPNRGLVRTLRFQARMAAERKRAQA